MISKEDLQTFTDWRRELFRTEAFICLLPHSKLREYISNYNITFPNKEMMPDCFTIMPSGCATISIERDHQKLAVYLEGPTTKPYVSGKQTNQLDTLVTVEFKPAGLYALTGVDQSDLVNERLSFELVKPQLAKQLTVIFEKAESIHAFDLSLDSLFLSQIDHSYHPQLIYALSKIVNSTGNTAVKTLSEHVHYSERHLNRLFKRQVGINTKSCTRLIRVNQAFQLLKKTNITLVSDQLGFYDLSHFTRDFKSVCDITPQEFCHNMSDFYINPQKY